MPPTGIDRGDADAADLVSPAEIENVKFFNGRISRDLADGDIKQLADIIARTHERQ